MREKSTAQLVVRIKPSVKELLKETADKHGVSMAELIESWVLEHCNDMPKGKMTMTGRYLQ